jgi:hypothetical protein
VNAVLDGWRRGLLVLWPSFVMAAVLEMLVFAVVDPGELMLTAGLSRMALYTLAFFVFWGATAAASALSVWMWTERRIDAPEGG